MKRRAKIPSIHRMIMLNSAGLILLVTVLITIVGSVLYYRIMAQQASYLHMQALNAVADKLDTVLGQFEYSSTIMVSNQQLVRKLISRREELLLGGGRDGWADYRREQEILSIIRDLRALTNIHAVGIYMDDIAPQYYISIMREDLYNLAPVQAAVEKVREAPDTIRWVSAFDPGYGSRIFAIVRGLRSPDTLDTVGSMAILVQTSYIKSILNNQPANTTSGAMYLVDDSGGIIIATDSDNPASLSDLGLSNEALKGESGSARSTLSSEQYFFVRLDRMGWRLIEVSDNRAILQALRNATVVQPLIAVFCLIVALFMTRAQANRIDLSLTHIMTAMHRVADGDLTEIRPDSFFRETDQLSEFLNATVHRLKNTLNLVYEKELAQKEAEFHSLQAQINPHFFYNTLETINMLLLVEEKYEMSNLVVSLADILRFNISQLSDVITVGEEILLIRKYMDIMHARFSDRLFCEIDCSQQAMDCKIIRLLIQPLVENAITHGMENTTGLCHILIRGQVSEGRLVITVEDDGAGIDPEVVAALMDGTYTGSNDSHNGVGIQNILKRIQLYYGEGYGLTLSPRPSGGTQAILSLPANFEKKER